MKIVIIDGLICLMLIIENLELREIKMVGRQFTWANDLAPPTFEKLDRVLMSSEWELKFPNVTV